jgi:phage N-6-adenine-methyltransferase
MVSTALFSSASVSHATPRDLFDHLNQEFNFVLDAAASASNAKCAEYIDEWNDALKCDWAQIAEGGAVWLNPPYGRGIGAWIAKAKSEAQRGGPVVCLLPARTDTKWWHESIGSNASHRPYDGVEVRFIKGRLRFGDATNAAPFPSVIVIFRGLQ